VRNTFDGVTAPLRSSALTVSSGLTAIAGARRSVRRAGLAARGAQYSRNARRTAVTAVRRVALAAERGAEPALLRRWPRRGSCAVPAAPGGPPSQRTRQGGGARQSDRVRGQAERAGIDLLATMATSGAGAESAAAVARCARRLWVTASEY
jgi:hypothetical protein